jgi:aryl-alcohol dehydrogenase-like predicted oxidoreductase
MDYRTLGRTDLRVSALALGTVELGMDYGINAPGHFGRPTDDAAIAIVHAAIDGGINLIDTARGYGESERILGQALRGKREQVIIATKVTTHLPDGTPPVGKALQARMFDQLETSLRLLQTDHVEIWQIHNVDAQLLAQWETIAETFALAQQQGKICWRGGSFYGAQLPVQALARDLFDVIQVTYSVFDQRISDQLLGLAHAQDVGVLVRSVLLKGALTERADHLPDHLESLRAQSRRFRQLVNEADIGLSPAQAALAFALAQERIQSVLVGVRTAAELADNLAALAVALSPELLVALTALRLDNEGLLNPGTWGIA